jgi:hypothetical protein
MSVEPIPKKPHPKNPSVKSILKFVYFEQKGGFNELNLRLRLIFVTADKVGMNRTLDLGFLVLTFLGLLPLRLCCLLGGVVVLGTFLLTNRTVHCGRCVPLVGWKTFVSP